MSKPILPDESLPRREPAAQVKFFADFYRRATNPVAIAWFRARVRDLSLHFSDDELTVLAALDTPDKVQEFLNTQIYYNNDHASVELEETAMPPRRVLQTGIAHCFEGALFAYAVNFLHGHDPRLVLLEACQDSEHNLVVCQDPRTGLFGCNAHSAFPNLDGRPAQYRTIRAMAESFVPYYYSDRTHDPNDLTLVGYSEPFDLIAKFGTAWIASEEHLWDIYYTYIDDTWRFHYLGDDSDETHLYPVVHALKEGWIQFDSGGKPSISVCDLPTGAEDLWNRFWRAHPDRNTRPSGRAREIEKQFMQLTGTTPIDLIDNADDLIYFLAAGYRVGQIVKK
ncbi:hypothetical protein ANRL1_03191 [Anaerolineae bacterium]|nr:hypothetical protein ANRL1_03191 [Anaerolineae bacterium]